MKQISEKIAELITEGESVKDAYDTSAHRNDKQQQVIFRKEQRWVSTSKAMLKFLSEEHYKEYLRIEDAAYYPQAKLAMKIGVLESAQDSIQSGLFGKMVLPERVWVPTTGSGWIRMGIRHQAAIRRESSRADEETTAWKTGSCTRSCWASSSHG